MKYYNLDFDSDDIWFLGEPTAGDNELFGDDFICAERYNGVIPNEVTLNAEGKEVQLNLAAFDMPVVSHEVCNVIEQIAPKSIERFPVKIDGASRNYEILNVLESVECIDETKTDFDRWKVEDGRPEKVGCYRTVANLKIRTDKIDGRHIFRIKGWEVALIVSQDLKDSLEKFRDLGVRFELVN